MKVSKEQLKALIKEELDAVMKEEETYTPRKDPAVQKMAGDAVRDKKALKGIEKHARDQIKKAKGQKTNPVGQKDRETSDDKLTGTYRGKMKGANGGYFGLEEGAEELEETVEVQEEAVQKVEEKKEEPKDKDKMEEGEDKEMTQISESFRRFTKILKG